MENSLNPVCRSPTEWFLSYVRKLRLLPRVETAGHIEDILEPGPLQEAAGNHAAVSDFAMDRNESIVIKLWWRYFEIIQGPPVRALQMSRLPLRPSSHIEHLQFAIVQAMIQLSHGDLRSLRQRQPTPLPRVDAATQISIHVFNTDPRQSDARFRQLFLRSGNQHGMSRETENRSCPRRKLPGE